MKIRVGAARPRPSRFLAISQMDFRSQILVDVVASGSRR